MPINWILGYKPQQHLLFTSPTKIWRRRGKHHNDPLHITVDAKGKKIPMIVIDDRSALNVCPLKTTSCLGLSIEDFMPSD